MNALHSIFLHFPEDTAINCDRWYVLFVKPWSWAHRHWKLDLHTHPPFFLLLAFSPFFFLFPAFSPLLPRSFSPPACTEGHAVNIPFRAAPYSRAAKLTFCCHESDSKLHSQCHLDRCSTSQSVLKCFLITPVFLCAKCVSAVSHNTIVMFDRLLEITKPSVFMSTLPTLL